MYSADAKGGDSRLHNLEALAYQMDDVGQVPMAGKLASQTPGTRMVGG